MTNFSTLASIYSGLFISPSLIGMYAASKNRESEKKSQVTKVWRTFANNSIQYLPQRHLRAAASRYPYKIKPIQFNAGNTGSSNRRLNITDWTRK